MKELLLYFTAFIVLDIISVLEGHIDSILATLVLSIIFYLNFKKELRNGLIYIKRYFIRSKNEKSTKI